MSCCHRRSPQHPRELQSLLGRRPLIAVPASLSATSTLSPSSPYPRGDRVAVIPGAYVALQKVKLYSDFFLQVLTNGIEVKLQRNVLSVIEAPSGNEEDGNLEFENVQWNGS
ncbi:hypothetical protein PIB30_065276 [Stylosanthes scabra]|uniref:Uncharacterized protein n=1 Tax=Stylosanthes scabra TaxID=79078 RepID=A0ABU6WLY3_9FABA|nr:hypothetical protein [Stylosanthes scabra]